MEVARCWKCGGCGMGPRGRGNAPHCTECHGVGFFGIDPRQPCPDPPGSTLKTAYMACRYAKGMPMDHPDDANYETAASPLPALGDAEEVFDELDQVEA